MRFSDVEKIMYEDQEFLKYLPLLKEEYWKKATPNKKLKIFNDIQKIINKLQPALPSEVVLFEMPAGEMQSVIVTEDCILMDENLLKKRFNPYDVITTYIFELSIVNFFASIDDEEFLNSEIGRRIDINGQESILKDWDNYLPRTDKNFFYQPVTWESAKVANKFAYNLLKYMNDTYGMDKYIGSKISGLMINSFHEPKLIKKVDEIFYPMEQNSLKSDGEKEKLESFFEYMNEVDLTEISDDEFFSMFNSRLMNVYDDQTLAYIFGSFLKRELKGFDELDDVLKEFMIGEHEDYGKFVFIGGSCICVNDYAQAFHNVVVYVSNIKLRENLCTEITDKKFLNDAKLCYEYILGLKDANQEATVKYLANALTYYEYRNLMFENYYKKIEKAIRTNKFYNTGTPFLNKGDFSKYEEYLQYAFRKNYEEVKKEQFADLEERYSKLIGGKR